jgi:quinoprotein glucose dehydrogenase
VENAEHATLSQITKANVHELAVAWTYPSNDNVAYVWNPLIVDNVMYVLARGRGAGYAAAGRAVYERRCVMCHGDNLS